MRRVHIALASCKTKTETKPHLARTVRIVGLVRHELENEKNAVFTHKGTTSYSNNDNASTHRRMRNALSIRRLLSLRPHLPAGSRITSGERPRPVGLPRQAVHIVRNELSLFDRALLQHPPLREVLIPCEEWRLGMPLGNIHSLVLVLVPAYARFQTRAIRLGRVKSGYPN